MGKTTLAASVMDDPRWCPCDFYDYDESAPAVAKYFGQGGPGRLIEVQPGDWGDLMRRMAETERRAVAGEIGALVWEGLSAYFRDDLGLEAAEHPDAIEAGGNTALKLRVAPMSRLGAIVAMVRRIKARAKRSDFVVILTAHSKEMGDMSTRELVPDMSRNAWQQLFRLAPVVLRPDRVGNGAPRIVFEDLKHEYHRIKDPNALAYFRQISQARDEAKLARMRTIPGLVGLLEHCERTAQADLAAKLAPSPAAEPTTST
jgi:hypothetical protein